MTTTPALNSGACILRIREREKITREQLSEYSGVPVDKLAAIEEKNEGLFADLQKLTSALHREFVLVYKDGHPLLSTKSIIPLLLEHNEIWTTWLKLKSPVPSSVLFQMQVYDIGVPGMLSIAAVDDGAYRLNFLIGFLKVTGEG